MAEPPSNTTPRSNVRDIASSLAQDPFWQSTPRYNRSSLAALMAAIKQVVPTPPKGARQRISAQTQSAARRFGQCTHMTMNRLHGKNLVCQSCGKTPSIGWLYACRQDWLLAHLDTLDVKTEPLVVPDESNYHDVMARLATSLHMSSHIVARIRSGGYTSSEIDRLIAQKEHVLAVIQKAENCNEDTPPSLDAVRRSHDPTVNIIATAGAPENPMPVDVQPAAPSNTPKSTPPKSASSTPMDAKHKGITVRADKCNYMVCHNCRPFIHDRLHVTVDSILKGQQPVITEEEIKSLPMNDPAVVRNLGLRSQPARITQVQPCGLDRSASMDITMHQRDGIDDDATPLDWTPSEASSSIYDDDEEAGFGFADPHPCPGAGICPVYSRNSGCAYDRDFNDGQRAVNHGFVAVDEAESATKADHITPDRNRYRLRRVEGSIADTPGRASSSGSSISLPTPTTIPLTPVTPTDEHFEDVLSSRLSKPGKAATVCGALSPTMAFGGLSGKNSISSLGSELEVEGGVALTEEAVETGLPDIITQA